MCDAIRLLNTLIAHNVIAKGSNDKMQSLQKLWLKHFFKRTE